MLNLLRYVNSSERFRHVNIFLFLLCFVHQDDQTPLHISSRLGKQDIVQQLLARGARPDATTNSGYTPLHLAAREGHRDIATALLDHGASLNIITKVSNKR